MPDFLAPPMREYYEHRVDKEMRRRIAEKFPRPSTRSGDEYVAWCQDAESAADALKAKTTEELSALTIQADDHWPA
jgi:hypothetical protein